METNLENLDKKVDEGFARLDTTLANISSQIQTALPTLVTHDALQLKVSELQAQIVDIKQEREKDKRANALQTWLTGTLSAAFGVLLTLLITHYINTR